MPKNIFIFILSGLYALTHTTTQSMDLMVSEKRYQKKLQKRLDQGLTGNELNARYNEIQHPLHIQLIYQGHTKLEKLLLEHLHVDNMHYIYNSGLIASTHQANFELIKLFVVKYGADVNTYEGPEDHETHKYYETPLITLCTNNTYYPTRILWPLNFLLRHNANPNLPSRWTVSPNKTALMVLSAKTIASGTVQTARCEAIQHLIISGANIMPQLGLNKTAVEIARERNNQDLVTTIETTANHREELFGEVQNGKNVSFVIRNKFHVVMHGTPKEIICYGMR